MKDTDTSWLVVCNAHVRDMLLTCAVWPTTWDASECMNLGTPFLWRVPRHPMPRTSSLKMRKSSI
ncbi:hypothetical protein PanWU01x14_072450 [Parasponia andersonii]|uniref:Uncharacterized protein n=1 Tax=Parasponia andersonii TaxID=3476 RepID=A0A2P5DDS4_PARAD|nr:hypothetical protein PanWU01x14_072450 [Parasponia andersonii]